MPNLDKLIYQLPQKYPFLMIDKVLEHEQGKKVVALKNVSINEYFFKGHFPDNPIMPGALIIESMAQAAILLFSGDKVSDKDATYYLTSVKVRFLHPVFPGDQIKIEIAPVKIISNAGIVEGICRVEEKIVAKGELSFSIK